ncbi:hypothetical protein [Saccharothrix sp. HUAS TT1]|uniref:hypothetical protein n=1 Tax=unclassified Saccharothrix TaxID=2593673 RepID=UPI00345BC122
MIEAFGAVQLIADELALLRRRQLAEAVPSMGTSTEYTTKWSEEFTKLADLIFRSITPVALAKAYALVQEGHPVERASYERGRTDAFEDMARNEPTTEVGDALRDLPTGPRPREIEQ